MTQNEIDETNKASLDRQRASRDREKTRKEIRSKEKEALSGVTSTADRRAIKKEFGALYDLDTSYTPRQNKTDYESDIGQRGVDQFTAPEATPSASGSGGIGNATLLLDYVDSSNTAQQATFVIVS